MLSRLASVLRLFSVRACFLFARPCVLSEVEICGHVMETRGHVLMPYFTLGTLREYKYWSQLELLFLSTLLLQVRNPSEAPPSMEILLSK